MREFLFNCEATVYQDEKEGFTVFSQQKVIRYAIDFVV